MRLGRPTGCSVQEWKLSARVEGNGVRLDCVCTSIPYYKELIKNLKIYGS